MLITHRYSARWANRFNRVTAFDGKGEVVSMETFVVPDSLILCDLCNADFPSEYDTEIPLYQFRDPEGPWMDIGTRCPDCQEGLEEVPRVKEQQTGGANQL